MAMEYLRPYVVTSIIRKLCLRTTCALFYFFRRLHDVETFFHTISFVSALYLVLPPSVSTLDSIFSSPVSMLELIFYWFDLNLTTFPTCSLVGGGPI